MIEKIRKDRGKQLIETMSQLISRIEVIEDLTDRSLGLNEMADAISCIAWLSYVAQFNLEVRRAFVDVGARLKSRQESFERKNGK